MGDKDGFPWELPDVIRAAYFGDLPALVRSLQRDDVNTSDGCGWTALHAAASMNHLAVVARLISAGADVNSRTSDGMTVLCNAASSASGSMIRLLIRAGAVVGAADASGTTPLHRAAEWDNLAAVRTLLRAGADLGALDDAQYSPLMRAAESGAAVVSAEGVRAYDRCPSHDAIVDLTLASLLASEFDHMSLAMELLSASQRIRRSMSP
ncbi:ankyrin repeat domain-containing protein [Herbiconiux sp. CPCC 203407]|uniref:Ankyrin repeat domain-containing protein n=1 Tax=Herbiconiux oxytropis TaxID=2970915 RepID=A0AA42BVE5_9MICO|nr:ankyrin repeat domain-containing protein [Herbiconiux oxytropis]MCS5720881.1 ankyrin repeat domain-containing protein [Herbiconiux oxytropis]MCS5724358.1 ankyrin repeat domain-containing protein [Herbiconiux oxytropis]